MEINLAISKIVKFGSFVSGDQFEIIERPMGGVSCALADASCSGDAGRMVSAMVVRKTIGLISEGVRDGAAARAASDYLFMERAGSSSVFLTIVSADFQTNTIVITRNNPTPVFVYQSNKVDCIVSDSVPIGNSRNIRPVINEIILQPGTTIVVFTDGVARAGERYGHAIDFCTLIQANLEEQEPTAQSLADSLLSHAKRLDQNQPNDDMTIIVLRVLDIPNDNVRRLNVKIPIPGIFLEND